jgi:hypothetical protein
LTLQKLWRYAGRTHRLDPTDWRFGRARWRACHHFQPSLSFACCSYHFSQIKDTRQSWKVAHPLRETLLLVVCATIANCDDYQEIVD